jgi:hypothetical protein
VPSISSRQVMRRLGLSEDFRNDPAQSLKRLHDLTMQEMTEDRLFALSEYSYLHATTLLRTCRRAHLRTTRRRTYLGRHAPPPAECAEAKSYYVAASMYAFAFLFPEDSRTPPSGFDPRLRVAVDIYNLSITSAIEPVAGKVRTGESSYPFHLGVLHLSMNPEELHYADRELEDLVPAAQLAVRGLRNRYRQPGIGAPFVASAVRQEGASIPLRSARVPDRVKVPITVLIRYEDIANGLRTGSMRAPIEVYTETEVSEIEIAERAPRIRNDLRPRVRTRPFPAVELRNCGISPR